MVWYNTFKYNEHTSIYMSIFELLNSYDIEKQSFNDAIKKYEDPMNLSPRSQAKQHSSLLRFISLFVKF